jgi:polyhydroxyalkanoate synthesis regulator phasin
LDLVHKDHLSVFTFADTQERFGLAKLVADGEKADLQVMSLDSTLTSSCFPVETNDEKALVAELLSQFTKASGKWDVKGLTTHWNMLCELMRLGTLLQRQINPKHHSQIASYLKSLDESYSRYSTTADRRDRVDCLREQLQRTTTIEPLVIPTTSKENVCRARVSGKI